MHTYVYVNESLLTSGALSATSTVNVTVLSVTPAHAGRLFALASVEIEIGGVAIELHGIRALRVGTEGTRIELPQFRDSAGLPRPVITLPVEVYSPIGDAVLETLVERGLAKRRFAAA
jgi:stage V sporulation protein G